MTIIRTVAFLFLLTITSMGIQLCQYPSLLLKTKSFRKVYKWYHVQTQQAFGSLVLVLTWIFCPISIVLSGDYKRLKSDRCILMANHQIYTDWWYVWILACQQGLGGNIKIILKHELSTIPIFGWGMRFFEFIFLKRKWALDRELLLSSLNTARSDGFPIWLLIFPEGTNITPGTRQKCVDYAKLNGISKIPRHLLIPRSTGLFTAVQEMAKNGFVTDIIDVTIGYDQLRSDDCPQYKYPIQDVFFKGLGPKVVHLHISAFKTTDIADFNDDNQKESFDKWLQDWYLNQKDELLDAFYTKGAFGTDRDTNFFSPIPQWHDWLRVTLFSWIAMKFIVGMFSAILY